MIAESAPGPGGSSIDAMPEGWVSAQVSDVTSDVPNVKPESRPDDDFGYVDISSICNRTFQITEHKRFKGRDAPSRARRPIEKGDVLFSNVRTYLRNIAIVPEGLDATLCSTGFTVLRSNGAVDPRFLFYYVLTDEFVNLVTPQQTGSQYPATSDAVVRSAPIAVPPLAEQKRIVAKVDELLARVDGAREHLDKVPMIIGRFRRSILAAACSGRLTEGWRTEHPGVESFQESLEHKAARGQSRVGARDTGPRRQSGVQLPELPKEWRWAPIEQLASSQPRSIQSGPFGSNLLHSEFQEAGILAIGIDNVLEGSFSPGRQHRISKSKYMELEKYTARPLDVLITVMATVGRCCVVPQGIETAIITKHVYRITTDHDVIEPHYLMRALQGDVTVNGQIQAQIRGQTRPGINGEILKTTFIPVPPIEEQREIVRRVEVLFKLADAVDRRVAAATVRTDKMTQSILAQSFRGELVPTEAELARQEGRSYEPASPLLARITAERERAKPQAKKRLL